MSLAYTDEMRRAFHSITPPKGFGVELIDNEFFLTIRADEKQFFHLTHDEKIEAAMYLNRLKKALEQEGAIVQVVRKALEK
jgi:hypothetical protein